MLTETTTISGLEYHQGIAPPDSTATVYVDIMLQCFENRHWRCDASFDDSYRCEPQAQLDAGCWRHVEAQAQHFVDIVFTSHGVIPVFLSYFRTRILETWSSTNAHTHWNRRLAEPPQRETSNTYEVHLPSLSYDIGRLIVFLDLIVHLVVWLPASRGENWNTIMYDALRALHPHWVAPVVIFIVLIFAGQTLFLNLFLTVLMAKFEEASEAEKAMSFFLSTIVVLS